MLGKLIKHEWKSTYKMGCLMLGAMVIITFLGWLSFQAPIWKSLGGRGGSVSWLDIFSIFTLIIYAMLLAFVFFGIQIYLGVHFYRTMFTDQGYLTHTLPVTKNQILISKVLVSGLWTLGITLSIFLSYVILGLTMVWKITSDWYLPAEILNAIPELFAEMESLFGFRLAHFLGMWIVTSVVGCFTSNIIMFGGLSLGQLMPRGRGFFGILYYFLISVGISIIHALFRSFASTLEGYLNLDVMFIVQILAAAALYAVSYYVISRKLNLT